MRWELIVVLVLVFFMTISFAKVLIVKKDPMIINYETKPSFFALTEVIDIGVVNPNQTSIVNEEVYSDGVLEVINIKYGNRTGITVRAKR